MAGENLAVTKFREYLRINTEQPNPRYYECRDFLYKYADELNLEKWSYECVKGKPIVGFTLLGTNPSLPSLFLYSHTDVVPTYPEHWKHDPYSAFKEENGDIFARGAQDMKCVGVQYMEALRILLKNNTKFLRTIHIVWGPEEEVGGVDGMMKFVKTDCFKQLNVGFALDEGVVSEDDTYRIFYGERSPWWIKIKCMGSPGHGSRFLENTAGPKLLSLMTSFYEYRDKQQKLLADHPEWTLGDVTSVNLTKIQGGVQTNVIPSEICAWFDIRITPSDTYKKIEALIAGWCEKAGKDVTYEFEQKCMIDALTPTTQEDSWWNAMSTALEEKNCKIKKEIVFGTTDARYLREKCMIDTLTPITQEDPWWNAMSTALEEKNCKIKKEIFIGGTDARYLREAGYKAIGFTPVINAPQLLHDHNEFLNEKDLLKGVEIYTKIIERLANVIE